MDIIKGIETIIEENWKDYDVTIEFLPSRHQILFGFSFFIENNQEEEVEFSDSVVFYNERKGKVGEGVLQSFPYKDKVGISKSVLEAILATLHECLVEFESKINDQKEEFFRLEEMNQLNEDELMKILQSLSKEEQEKIFTLLENEEEMTLSFDEELYKKKLEEKNEQNEWYGAPKY